MVGYGGNSRWSEELFQYDVHPTHHLGEQEVVPGFVEDVRFVLVPAIGRGKAERCGWWVRAIGCCGVAGGSAEGVALDGKGSCAGGSVEER